MTRSAVAIEINTRCPRPGYIIGSSGDRLNRLRWRLRRLGRFGRGRWIRAQQPTERLVIALDPRDHAQRRALARPQLDLELASRAFLGQAPEARQEPAPILADEHAQGFP